jgi:hypothetical protein
MRWLDEKHNQWYSCGTVSLKEFFEWVAGEEVIAPQPGGKYVLIGPTGNARERTVESTVERGEE